MHKFHWRTPVLRSLLLKKDFKKKDFFIKKRLQHRSFRCFPVKFAKHLRTPIFIEHLVAVIPFKKVWFLNQNIYAQLLERSLKVFERWLPISNFLKLLIVSLHKKWSFPLRISSVNVTKPVVSCGFGHIYWRNTKWKTSFFVQCLFLGDKSR